MTRLLTQQEIEDILDFITPSKYIPEDTAHSVMMMNKTPLINQLSTQEVYPEIIPELKKCIMKQYYASMSQPGESVGILCAQSIGEMQTQTTLNTFHSAGASNKTMTRGVPRFRELIDATKFPKIVNNTIYFTEHNTNIDELRMNVSSSIAGLKMSDITLSMNAILNKPDEQWYPSFEIIFGESFRNYDHCISMNIDMTKLFEYKLSLKEICERIEEEYSDLTCVFSPPGQHQIDIFIDTSSLMLPESRLEFIDTEQAPMIYMEECVLPTLEKMYICGIPAINEIFYTKDDDNDEEWIIETNGTNSKKISKQYSSFKKLLSHPLVDYTRTISNNVWDIYEVLDIEAARQFLIEEFTEIVGSNVNPCHTYILVDRMTYLGTISSITRYTLKTDESGPMGKASFEETMDNFLDAASQGQHEPTRGVSASIICGKRSSVGTGMVKTMLDIDYLESLAEEEDEEDEEDEFNDLSEDFENFEI